MPTAADDAMLVWPDDLGAALAGAGPVDDPALLDPGYRAELLRCAPSEVGDLAAAVLERLWRPPFFVVVRGLTFDSGHRLLAAVAASLGHPVQPYPDSSFAVIRTLRPATSSTAPGWGALTESLHTDSTNWPQPHDHTMMLCAYPDQRGGGASLILPLTGLVAAVAQRLGAAAVDRLRDEPVPWAVDPGLGGGIVTAPVLSGAGVRWQLYRVAEAVDRGATCPADTLAFMRSVDAALLPDPAVREFLLRRHDLLVLNNRACVHARRPVAGHSERAVVHCKVAERDVRPDLTYLVGPAAAHAD